LQNTAVTAAQIGNDLPVRHVVEPAVMAELHGRQVPPSHLRRDDPDERFLSRGELHADSVERKNIVKKNTNHANLSGNVVQ